MARGPRPSPTSNRTDRLAPEPVTTVPGQGYGVAGEQAASERVIPLAGSPSMQGGSPNTPQTQPSGGPAGGPADLLAMAQAHNGPGSSLALNRPTERPNEPVTHGLPMGPGAGPEALTGVGAAARENVMEQATVRQFLNNLAAAPNAPSAVKDLNSRAQSGVV